MSWTESRRPYEPGVSLSVESDAGDTGMSFGISGEELIQRFRLQDGRNKLGEAHHVNLYVPTLICISDIKCNTI